MIFLFSDALRLCSAMTHASINVQEKSEFCECPKGLFSVLDVSGGYTK